MNSFILSFVVTLLELQTNLSFLDRILHKLSILSGGREGLIIAVFFVLLLFLLLFVFQGIRRAKKRKALEYHIEEKDKYHIHLEKKNLDALSEVLLKGLGGRDNIVSVRVDGKKIKVKIREYTKVEEQILREGGFPGFVRPAKEEVHVLVGEEAEALSRALENRRTYEKNV